ncbi:MAG TPA: hypothetical protein VMV41_09755 [Cellulomonadaceae bacterium]|nr:hypothetical protein [Cellulomonadaceae bacterium]
MTAAVPAVPSASSFSILQGDSYLAADSRQLAWTTNGAWPDLTAATIAFEATPIAVAQAQAVFTKAGSVVTPTGASAKVQAELAAADTTGLAAGTWDYAIVATISVTAVVTLARGTMTVEANPA